MRSIKEEILQLNTTTNPIISYSNANRYRADIVNADGSKTAYCFGVPIYNINSNKLVELRFKKSEKAWQHTGSNVFVNAVNDTISMENKDGICTLQLEERMSYGTEQKLCYGLAGIYPTLNGVALNIRCAQSEKYKIRLFLSPVYMQLRTNNRCFSLMKGKFSPYVTVSCIGVLDGHGRILAPCKLEFQKYSDKEYELIISHTCPFGNNMLIEINMYEEKLFQDTTVESKNPTVNNAFGGTAFIGDNFAYGEQWLYGRPDTSKLNDLYDKQILKAVLYMPELGGCANIVSYGISERFCSFGSNWQNKIAETVSVSDGISYRGYQEIDITNVLTNQANYIISTNGYIIRSKKKNDGFKVISTGDSFYYPQILKLNYRI